MAGSKLLNDPEGYAKRALEVLNGQLGACKSKTRAARLHARKVEWQKLIEFLQEPDNSDEKNIK